FAIALAPWYRECVEYNGLTSRLAAIRTLDAPFRDVGTVQDEQEELLVELANRTVREDAADVVILAGAPLAGLAARVRERVPVPLTDGAAAAVKQAEALVALAPRKATAGTYRTPAAKPATGLPPALTRWIAGPR